MKTKIYLYAEIELDLTEVDDQGTVDNWVVCTMKEIINEGPELDDIYANLNLDWSFDKPRILSSLKDEEINLT